MASAYASAIGTCVIRHVHIPQMPPEFAKQVMLFEVVAGASEATLRNELPRASELTAVELLEDGNACVTYSSPQHAEQAIKDSDDFGEYSDQTCVLSTVRRLQLLIE